MPIHSLRMNGILAEQQVVFGGTGEVLRITHETLGDSSYETGILLGLRALPSARGVVVGLENLLELNA